MGGRPWVTLKVAPHGSSIVLKGKLVNPNLTAHCFTGPGHDEGPPSNLESKWRHVHGSCQQGQLPRSGNSPHDRLSFSLRKCCFSVAALWNYGILELTNFSSWGTIARNSCATPSFFSLHLLGGARTARGEQLGFVDSECDQERSCRSMNLWSFNIWQGNLRGKASCKSLNLRQKVVVASWNDELMKILWQV